METWLIVAFWFLACPAFGLTAGWFVWVLGSPVMAVILALWHPQITEPLFVNAARTVLSLAFVVVLSAVTCVVHTLRRDGLRMWRPGMEPVLDVTVPVVRRAETVTPPRATVPSRRPGRPIDPATPRKPVESNSQERV